MIFIKKGIKNKHFGKKIVKKKAQIQKAKKTVKKGTSDTNFKKK